MDTFVRMMMVTMIMSPVTMMSMMTMLTMVAERPGPRRLDVIQDHEVQNNGLLNERLLFYV